MLHTVGRQLVAVAWLASGCGAGWRQVPLTPSTLTNQPEEVRITRPDGSRLIMKLPRIERDSLFGEVDGEPRSMAMADVQRIALPEASNSRKSAGTVVVVTALAVAILAWVVIIVGSD